ncbi:hypothetical protein [Phycicoccus sp. DTK01]|uniref:hypothetical protein n=1 Tax=Phycicoccus sp. DTK01 TaxID=2785745 RepID=UPI001A8EB8E9|nr:hypothetical protein [Phycicoccus sp. DTK01]
MGTTARVVMTAALLLGSAGGPVAASASAAAPQGRAGAVAGCDSTDIRAVGDLDGDGVPEVVVGMPTLHPQGGGVDVRFTRGGGQQLTGATFGLGTPSSTEQFGAAVLVTELNGDRCADLVIGVPGHGSSGAVVIALGSPGGYRGADARVVSAPSSAGVGSRFGASLTMVRHTTTAGVTRPVLVVGAIGAVAPNGRAGGGVVAIPVPGGVPGTAVLATEDTPGVAGVAESGDLFGQVLAPAGDGTVVVGTPREDIGSVRDAGAVSVLTLDGDMRWSGSTFAQSTAGVPGSPEQEDNFGWSVTGYSLASGGRTSFTVGVPREDIGSTPDVGSAVSLSVTGATVRGSVSLTQGGTWRGRAVPGGDEAYDYFGWSLGWRKQARDTQALVVGAPGEGIGTRSAAGAVTTFDDGAEQNGVMSAFNEASYPFSGGHVEGGDWFGGSIASGTYLRPGDPVEERASRLLVGERGEDVGSATDAGAVGFSDEQGPGRYVTRSSGPTSRLWYGEVLGVPTYVAP